MVNIRTNCLHTNHIVAIDIAKRLESYVINV